MYHELAIHFFRKVTKECAFLITEHGFGDPRCVLHRNTAHVTFVGKNIAVEFTYTEPLDEVDCHILLAEERRKAEAPTIASDTKYKPILLEDLVKGTTGSSPDFHLPAETPQHFKAITHFVGEYARILRSDVPDVLADKPYILA